MKRIQLIYYNNGAGLSRDADILESTLQNHFEVIKTDWNSQKEKEADINLYLEHCKPEFKFRASKNIVIPNPEWWELNWNLKNIDQVFAKTHAGKDIFDKIHRNVKFISFTSQDRYLDIKKVDEYYHSAGKSQSKGTKEIVRLWRKSAEIPKLNLFTKPDLETYGGISLQRAVNINHRIDVVPDKEFRKIQNKYRFHLCPSLYEGFGHYINEAKSCKSVVFATNAAPMNELVTNKFGVLIRYSHTKKMRLATTYHCKAIDIWRAITTFKGNAEEMGELAREDYLRNDKLFKERLLNELI